MQKTLVNKIDGHNLLFCQCTTKEEIKENQIPGDNTFFWEYQNEKIFDPSRIMSMVVASCQKGEFNLNIALDSVKLRDHYANVVKTQSESINNHLDNITKSIDGQAMAPEYKESLQKTLNNLRDIHKQADMIIPDFDGVARPTVKQAQTYLGKEIWQKMYGKKSKEELAAIFK